MRENSMVDLGVFLKFTNLALLCSVRRFAEMFGAHAVGSSEERERSDPNCRSTSISSRTANNSDREKPQRKGKTQGTHYP